MRKVGAVVGVLLTGVSIWIGAQIGITRDSFAAIFLFVIPCIVVISLFFVLKQKKEPDSLPEQIQSISRDIEELRTGLISRLDRLIAATSDMSASVETLVREVKDEAAKNAKHSDS